MAGGTLADRLRQGPAPAAEAVSMAAVLGDALGALHRAVVALTASLLTADRATRPATARAFVYALDAGRGRAPSTSGSAVLPVGDRG